MTTYLSAAAREHLAVAQSQLDRHTPTAATGRCGGCGEAGPCRQRRAALRAFGRYGVLPRRWPGASRPDLVRGVPSWSGWLAAVVDAALR
ncbi:hypothetical protein ABT336_14615 [Micromonospora sp. NPDC000207]|uniref:hypothetical protein n=1 Tax=Micromonospora sp. NPDC000207 TaxID=3154246 RepID=UPI00332AD9C4